MRNSTIRTGTCAPLRQALLLGLMGLAAYMAAAAAELSAVLAVFFAGLTMSHYTWHSMSPAGRSLALHSFRVVSGECLWWPRGDGAAAVVTGASARETGRGQGQGS
jgi:hypothetical protein